MFQEDDDDEVFRFISNLCISTDGQMPLNLNCRFESCQAQSLHSVFATRGVPTPKPDSFLS